MYIDPADKLAWADDLKDYQQQRKQRVEFKKPKIFTQKEMKLRQTEFNPVLQVYQNPERDGEQKEKDMMRTHQQAQKKFETVKKYLHEYDLVTLDPIQGIERPDEKERIKQCLLPPNFNDYNIITNEKISEDYYKNMKVVVAKKVYNKPTINRNKRDYNILTNKYLENHDNKAEQDLVRTNEQLYQLSSKVRNFDLIQGKYYDQNKEDQFQRQLKDEQLNHGKNFNDRLPPAWKFRESVYLDQTKEVPEEIRMIDEINKNHKKRYQVRHVLEHEYKERDIQDQQRAEARLLARHKYDDMIKKYDKEFDILTLSKPEIDHILKALPPKPPQNSWDKVQMTKTVNGGGLREVSIPEGIDLPPASQSLKNSMHPSQGKPFSAPKSQKSQNSVKKEESIRSVARSVAKSEQQEIKSGGFFLKQND